MKKIILLLPLLALLFACTTDNSISKAKKIEAATLKEAAAPYNILIGAAVEPEFLSEEAYVTTLSEHFNFITPENKMKWDSIHPSKEKYNFDPADTLVNFAMDHNMKVRGHALVWHSQNPPWLTSREWSRDELIAILKDHITTVVSHYKGKIHVWDVVNEAIDGDEMRKTIWYEGIGPEYIEMAFRWAHEADPDAILIYNDYGNEEIGPKSNVMFDMVLDLKNKGVPIDGVGLQLHLEEKTKTDFESIYMNVNRFYEAGLLVDFTEIDIRIISPAQDIELKTQAEKYRKLLEILMSFPGYRAFTVWGVSDTHSWIPGFFTGTDDALVFDKKYQAKPAFYELMETLKSGPRELNYKKSMKELMSGRKIVPAFQAAEAESVPVLDGKLSPGEWDNGIIYPFGFNQLSANDQRPPADPADFSGSWSVLYKGNTLFGYITRTDDITVIDNPTDHENDNLEIFFDINGTFAQLRSKVGEDWMPHDYQGKRKIVWNAEGTIAEFAVELPDSDLANMVSGWNIALSDNDGKEIRDHQLYPICGQNDGWEGKNLGTMKYIGDSPRPPEKERVILPFLANPAEEIPVIDGNHSEKAWENALIYPFLYNQLNQKNQTITADPSDISGEWAIIYSDGTLYGYVERNDDITVTNLSDTWENDNVELFLQIGDGFIQLRSIIGSDWEDSSYSEEVRAVWNNSGKSLEFSVKLPSEEAKKDILGFNIALSDNDGDTARDYQLYPVNGFNDGWQGKHFAELQIVR